MWGAAVLVMIKLYPNKGSSLGLGQGRSKVSGTWEETERSHADQSCSVTAHSSSGRGWGFEELAGHGGLWWESPPRLFFTKGGGCHQHDPCSCLRWGAAGGCNAAGCCNWQLLENGYVNVKLFLCKCKTVPKQMCNAVFQSTALHCHFT